MTTDADVHETSASSAEETSSSQQQEMKTSESSGTRAQQQQFNIYRPSTSAGAAANVSIFLILLTI
jgi:hypothetical protein